MTSYSRGLPEEHLCLAAGPSEREKRNFADAAPPVIQQTSREPLNQHMKAFPFPPSQHLLMIKKGWEVLRRIMLEVAV